MRPPVPFSFSNCETSPPFEVKTLEQEEVGASSHAAIDDARSRIGYFIEEICNRKRRHSVLNERPVGLSERRSNVHWLSGPQNRRADRPVAYGLVLLMPGPVLS